MQYQEPEEYWLEHSDIIKEIGVTINEDLSPHRCICTVDIFKKHTSFIYNASELSEQVLAFFKKHYSQQLDNGDLQDRQIVCKIDTGKSIVSAAAIQSVVIAEYLFCFVLLSATHYSKRRTGLQRKLLNECDRVLQTKAGERDLKGAFLITKCKPSLTAFYQRCHFGFTAEPFSGLWKEDGLAVMCRPVILEGQCLKIWPGAEEEAEKVHVKNAANSKEPVVKRTVSKKQVVAKATKKVKKQKEEKSTLLDYDSSSLSAKTSDDEFGPAPTKKAKEEKPVQIYTSTNKVAATIKKAVKPRVKPQPKTKAIDTIVVVDDDTDSEGDSVESKMPTKSACGALNKHCMSGSCDGRLITGNSWFKHNSRKHSGGGIVSYTVCTGNNCNHCQQVSKPKAPRVVKYYTCSQCDEERRYDRFPAGKDKSVCVHCIDGKSCRGSVKGFEKASLKSAILDKLPKLTTFEQLNDSSNNNDSISMVSSRSKRQKTAVPIIEPSNIEFAIVKQLEAMEKNGKSVHINAFAIQDICHRFDRDLIIQFFHKLEYPNLLKCVNQLLEVFESFSVDQVAGLLIVSFTLGHESWVNSIATLGQMEEMQLKAVLNKLKCVISRHYTKHVAEWCCSYWKYMGKDQFALLKALKESPDAADDGILLISLCSSVGTDIKEHIDAMSAFIRHSQTTFQLLQDHLKSYPKQTKIQFDSLLELTLILRKKSYATAIHSIREILCNIPVYKWKDQIELAQATSTVIDGDSIQKSLNEFVAKYGKPSESKLATDLQLSGDVRFQFFTKAVLNPPNNKQFATAQYCLGLFKNHQRQMWCVPSGQGKGRIEHTLAVFALLLGFSKVYIFYSSKQLYDRDIAEFSTYLKFVKKDQIQYCIEMDGIVVGDNELVIFDEGDATMHNDPDKFRDFVSKCLCVCFTATPDDQDPRGVDIQVLKAMTFSTFYYVLDVLERIIKFDFDLELPTMPVIEKAAEVKKLSQTGPVVVHCIPALYAELKKLDLELVEADENVEHHTLKTLGVKVNNKFRVAVALTTAAMRGLDYRSSVDGILIQLVIAKSFENKREAMQGYYRVGRFNDKCYRVAFKDVDLVDPVAELSYKLNALNFLNTLSTKTIQMKQINVIDLSGQSKKTPAATDKTALAATNKKTGQSQAQYQGNMSRKRVEKLLPHAEEKQGHTEQASAQPLE